MMERVHRMPDRQGYLIPGALIHSLIIAIVTAIIAIGGYMVAWSLGDSRFKAEVITRLTKLEDLVALHDTYRRQSDQSVTRINKLEKDLHRVEDRVYGTHNGDRGQSD